jgi:hypothetical protein
MSEIKSVWTPLERAALLSRHHPDLPSFHEWEFMYVYSQPETGPHRVHAYKHRDTRKYIHLADDECVDLDSLADDIAGLGLDEFDTLPALYRSTPADQWPPDDPAAVAALGLGGSDAASYENAVLAGSSSTLAHTCGGDEAMATVRELVGGNARARRPAVKREDR